MQGYYHATVEMYRDTTDHRNIQKQVGAMQEKYGRNARKIWARWSNIYDVQNKKNRKRRGMTAEQERYNEVRKKQRQ